MYAKTRRPGRPRKIDAYGERQAHCALRSGAADTAVDLQRDLFPHATARTVSGMLNRTGFKARRRRKKPWLSAKQIIGRRRWSRMHVKWTVNHWKRVVFSGESKFNLFGSDGLLWCRRRPGEEFEPRNLNLQVKHGGGHVMVWGCITWTAQDGCIVSTVA